jgi:hypothetical protein
MAKSNIEKMAERLKVLESAEVELAAADAEVQAATLRLAEADRVLTEAAARALSGGWPDRQAGRKAEAARQELRRSLTRAEEAAEAKRSVVETLRDEVAELRTQTTDRMVKAAVRKAEEITAILRREQADLVKTARKAVALRAAVERIVPRRIVSQRVPGKYFRVVSDAPAMQELYKGNKPPGSFSVEPLKAIAGARAGKWRIVEGQDMVIGPSEIETTWSDGPLPKEIEDIRELQIGKIFGGTAEDSRNALDFPARITRDRGGDSVDDRNWRLTWRRNCSEEK